MMAKQNDKPQE